MPESKSTSPRRAGMNVDTKLVRELAELLAETGLTEIEVEDGDRKVRVARGGVAVAAPAPISVAPAAVAPAATAPAPAEASTTAHADALKSPMVGTCYLAAEPGSPNFVSVGSEVKPGDTLLIIEAMKVMNPIKATKGGTVIQLLVENGQPVEYGDVLVVIE